MPLNVQLVNAQVKDPQSGQMTPAGLIGSDAISTINTAKNQAIAAVQQKGEETLQSIPDDYTALSNEVDDVKTQLNNVDNAPVQGSDNLVKSGGVYSSLESTVGAERIRAIAAENLKVNKPTVYPNGTPGQLLKTNGDGTTEWVDEGLPSPQQTEDAINSWLNGHPEATTTVQDGSLTKAKFTDALKLETLKDYVTPQMYGYTSESADVGTYINQALLEHDTVFIPDGIYKVLTTITLTGDNLIVYDGKYHQTKGKTIIFGSKAIFDIRADIDVFDISGNGNTISGGLIDLTTVGSNYSHSVIYLHSENSNNPCFSNKIEGIFISNANNTNKGTGIKLYVSGTGYVYSNIVDNVKLQKLEYGIQFAGASTNGMNSNMFTNISYWSCTQCAIITGGGNTFTGVGQCGAYRDASDESACFYVGGNNNTIDVFIYDVGNTGLTKYIYELSQTAFGNILRYNGVQNYIGNQKLNKFFGYEKNENPVVLARNSTSAIYDYSRTGSDMFKISNFDGCFDVNNFLNTEYVSNIECILSSDAPVNNIGIALDNISKLRELAKTTSNSAIKLAPRETGSYTLQIKYTFNFAGISSDKGTLEYFALKTSSLFSACAKNVSTITVKQILDDDSEIDMVDLTSFANANQTSIYRVFKAPNTYITKKVKNLIINITVNATAITNAYILYISKLYATFVGDGKNGDSYNGLANRSGDTIFGDYLFKMGYGVILTSPNGTKYKISVANNGTISSTVVT